jgi:hypothetical protein
LVLSLDPEKRAFAIDFLKDHPATTIAEFKKVFDNLDEET